MAVWYTESASSGGDMSYKNIIASSQSPGDLHLSDASWATSKALIQSIHVDTASTNWDLWLLQNDNGYSANDAAVPAVQIMGNGNGNLTIALDYAYEDEDASDEVHLYFVDHSGSNTGDFYINGLGLS